jgi:hypothetical protein
MIRAIRATAIRDEGVIRPPLKGNLVLSELEFNVSFFPIDGSASTVIDQ